MFPFKLGPIEIASLSVIGLDKADQENYMVETKHEEPLVSVKADAIGSDITLDTPDLTARFVRTEEDASFISFASSKIDFSLEKANFDGTH